MQVKAIEAGYYGGVWRDAGVRFNIENIDAFSKKWMAPANPAAKQAVDARKGVKAKTVGRPKSVEKAKKAALAKD